MTIQQVQKRHTVLPMAQKSSMDIYASRSIDENGKVTPDMEGWLHKQGCKYKKWNKRWFVLKGPNLFYFKSPKVLKLGYQCKTKTLHIYIIFLFHRMCA